MRRAAGSLLAMSMSACASTTLALENGRPSFAQSRIAIAASSYRITGDGSVRPISVIDDGSRMEIAWSRSQAIPAVFAIGDQGQEEVVNGYMRDDTYVIDRVYAELRFRIDNAQATARRVLVRRR